MIKRTSAIFKFASYVFPKIQKLEPETDASKFKKITLIHPQHITQVNNITPQNIKEFNQKHKVTVGTQGNKVSYINFFHTQKEKLQPKSKVVIDYSVDLENHPQLSGALSNILSSTYQFTMKTIDPPKQQPQIYYSKDSTVISQAIQLAHSKSFARDVANQRGNIATTQYMEEECRKVARECGLEIKVLKDYQIQNQNLPLLKAVGQASIHQPRLVNLSYKGDPSSEQWIALIGKGLCYDSGGLNIKTGNFMLDMHLDKHGSCSVLSAIKTISKLKLKANVTASFGFVQNSISNNAFRPSDVIKSRNGLTVEIGNTDAEGRLTLADVMTWTLDRFKPKTMIELSTLTGAVVISLGHSAAGLWTNNQQLTKQLLEVGNTSRDRLWHLPILEEHRELVKGKVADLTNSSGKNPGASSQAAAFLQSFVPKDVRWAHIDIAGASMIGGMGTGFGSRLLIKYIQSISKSK